LYFVRIPVNETVAFPSRISCGIFLSANRAYPLERTCTPDDPIVKYQNSELLAEALADRHIVHKYIQYRTGGHGFGATAAKTTPEAIAWLGEFLEWFEKTILQQ
jgi:hypothetical protein